jgi:predicted acetyltransferase
MGLGIRVRTVEGAYAVEYILSGDWASRVVVRDLRMRIGGAVMRCGGIADVETREYHRRRGYSRQTLERAVSLMSEKGYDISALFGISDFYSRWGFAPVFPDTRIMMATKDAALAHPDYRLRRLGKHEIGAAVELYRRNNAQRTGSIVRRRDRWAGFRQGSRYKWPANVYGAFDGTKRLMGYVVIDKSPAEAIISEVGYRSEEVLGTLLSAAVRQARRVHDDHIAILAPMDHPFVEFCRQFGCRVVMQYHRSGGAMARIINLPSCFARLAPELTRRMRAGRYNWSGRLTITTDIGQVALRFEKGVAACEESPRASGGVLRTDQALLTQLLFGYRSPAEALRSGAASLRGAPVELLEVLFPQGQAYCWHPDHF